MYLLKSDKYPIWGIVAVYKQTYTVEWFSESPTTHDSYFDPITGSRVIRFIVGGKLHTKGLFVDVDGNEVWRILPIVSSSPYVPVAFHGKSRSTYSSKALEWRAVIPKTPKQHSRTWYLLREQIRLYRLVGWCAIFCVAVFLLPVFATYISAQFLWLYFVVLCAIIYFINVEDAGPKAIPLAELEGLVQKQERHIEELTTPDGNRVRLASLVYKVLR